MSWGERSCSKERAPKNKDGYCDVAEIRTCNVDCKYYTWDGKTKPDSEHFDINGFIKAFS